MANNKQSQAPKNEKQKQSSGTEEIVRQHLKDPNHIITDEDIKRVEVGKFEKEEEYEGELLPEKLDESKPEDTTQNNAWDIVS